MVLLLVKTVQKGDGQNRLLGDFGFFVSEL